MERGGEKVHSYEDLNEKAIEVILNFKPEEKFNKASVNEIFKLKNSIKRIITTLPEEEQEILNLRYSQNETIDEITNKTGKSKEEVIKVLSRGIERIKENLRDVKAEKPLQETNKSKAGEIQTSSLIKFLPIIVFIVIWLVSFVFLQKFFSSQLPTLSQISVQINNFVQDQVFNNQIFKSSTQGIKNFKNVNSPVIEISGSSSLLALSRKWQDAFVKEFSKYQINLIDSDSDQGINDLINGKVDVANSSRPVTYSDEKKANENNVDLVEYRVALDALIIIVNSKNPLEEISLDDLKNIFSAEVKNWAEISIQDAGGKSGPIHPLVREKGSGTNDFVINRILQSNDFPSSISREKSNEELIKIISEDVNSISFINSTNYPWNNENVKFLKIKNYENSIAISPFEEKKKKLNEQALRYGDYPLSHYLYLITLSEIPKKVEDYVEWVRSAEGQGIVKNLGLVSVVEE